jgi:predicted anti-sigma-YlaC factor YlaD
MSVALEIECAETLTDLLCYEIFSGRLSAEMEAILEHHLQQCSSCRRRFQAFLEVTEPDRQVRNYG